MSSIYFLPRKSRTYKRWEDPGGGLLTFFSPFYRGRKGESKAETFFFIRKVDRRIERGERKKFAPQEAKLKGLFDVTEVSMRCTYSPKSTFLANGTAE